MLINKAAKFAIDAHGKQVRKYTGLPYVTHCAEVAMYAEAFYYDLQVKGHSLPKETLVAAAWLHDVLEDTDVTANQIFAEFGSVVGNIVVDLTDVYTAEAFPKLNRDARKATEALRLGSISPFSQYVKGCDMLSNTPDILKNDPNFAKVYLREKAEAIYMMDIPSRDLEYELFSYIPNRYLDEAGFDL